ncbi:MAG: recombinase family protein [Sphingobacteriia bacterium]|nr:recombinase family protein [Sphingobacteriia bacterium]
MQVGYVRVSKSDGSQILDLQKDALKKIGISDEYIYEDYASGSDINRPGLKACLKALRENDVLVVWALDRIGRDQEDLIKIINDLNERKIGFKVLTGQGACIDTTSSHGKLVFGIFAAMAEFERARIIERTRAGLEAARARGRVGGRPKKLTDSQIMMIKQLYLEKNNQVKDICNMFKISKTSLYRIVEDKSLNG